MKQLLNEKYRPRKLGDYIFKNKDLEEKVKDWISTNNPPNLLISGPAGTGKSSLLKILINQLEIQPSDLKVVNSASDSGIDYYRNTLEPWLSVSGFGMKVVLLEEFERVTPDAQKALKLIIENCSDRVRFFATSNNISRMDPAIFSRFQHIELDSLDEESVLDRMVDIVEGEGLYLHEDDDFALMSHFDQHYPNMRNIINSMDLCTRDGVLYPCEASSAAVGQDEWQRIWDNGQAEENLIRLIELAEGVDANNYDWYYETMYQNHQNFKSPPEAIIILSQYLDRATRVANQRLTLTACLYNLFAVEL